MGLEYTEPYQYEEYMGEGIGAIPSEVWKTDRDLMLVYVSDKVIKEMQPDFGKLKEFPVGLSVYVTAESNNPDYDIVARAFWPKLNIENVNSTSRGRLLFNSLSELQTKPVNPINHRIDYYKHSYSSYRVHEEL